ncbi:MAG: hypothetical protein H5T66_06235, partial [Chloroflexi bacterium]|nr:hypothetical protein [Chloroflexota bacterium]
MIAGTRGRAICGFLLMALLLGCGKKATPLPPPTPTLPPTPTPTVKEVLEEQNYTISRDGQMLAVEHLTVSEGGEQIIVASEVRWLLPVPVVERRTAVLSQGLNALRYDLERTAFGVRSAWVLERTGEEAVDYLSNNQDWLAPVYIRGISPAPHLPLESSPSALPYALMALKYAASGQEHVALRVLDVLEDYPVTQPLTVTFAPERKGAVIGTVALEGVMAGEETPRFTMWVQPKSRVLFSVEVPEYRFSLWAQRANPALAEDGRLLIQRVGKLPEAPAVTPTAPSARRIIPLAFRGEDGAVRQGALALPEGEGPFPCLVVHSADGAS